MLTGSHVGSELRPKAAEPRDLSDPSLYINRELSWLAFNDRVLEEAMDERNPLLERLKFIAIFGTNLDEFFMIRIAGLMQQMAAEVHRRSDDGLLPEEQLVLVSKRLRGSLARMDHCLQHRLFPALAEHGIRILRYDDLDSVTRRAMRRWFDERVFPVLTPLAIDKGHPFPYISNLSLSLAVELEETSAAEGDVSHFARVKIPPLLPRFVPLESAPAGQRWYVMLEDVVAHNLEALFPGLRVIASHAFRVTRDADLDLQEDEADDLLRAIESELRRRRFGEPVRLEVEPEMPPHLRAKLLEALELEEPDCYEAGMLGAERSLDPRRDRRAGAARSAVHSVDPEAPDRPARPLRGDPRRRRAAAPPVRVVRSGRAVRAPARRAIPTCWRSNRRCIARRGTRRSSRR